LETLNGWLTANGGLIALSLVALVLFLAGVLIWLLLRMRRLERAYRMLTAGADGGNLEAVLEDHMRQVREAIDQMRELDALTRRLERSSRAHLQRLGFLRFNPFRDAGGDQSFAVVLADQDGNGVAVSSLHSRDVTRVYAKPLAAWESAYQLTDEEQKAIQRAKGEAE